MSYDIVQVVREALWLVLALSAPPIAAASLVGLLVAFIQAATQLQEQTLTYTVKFVTITVVLLIMSSLMGATLLHFADRLFTNFPLMTR